MTALNTSHRAHRFDRQRTAAQRRAEIRRRLPGDPRGSLDRPLLPVSGESVADLRRRVGVEAAR